MDKGWNGEEFTQGRNEGIAESADGVPDDGERRNAITEEADQRPSTTAKGG